MASSLRSSTGSDRYHAAGLKELSIRFMVWAYGVRYLESLSRASAFLLASAFSKPLQEQTLQKSLSRLKSSTYASSNTSH